MARIEALVERSRSRCSARRASRSEGTRSTSSRPGRASRFVDALEEHELWTRDEAELRARLEERGVDTQRGQGLGAARRPRASRHYVEPDLIEPTILHDYPVELSPFARLDATTTGARRALRVLRRRHGARQRVLGDQRRRGAARALRRRRRSTSRASRATPTTSRRSRTACRRPAGSASASTAWRCCSPAARLDPRRDPVPGAALVRSSTPTPRPPAALTRRVSSRSTRSNAISVVAGSSSSELSALGPQPIAAVIFVDRRDRGGACPRCSVPVDLLVRDGTSTSEPTAVSSSTRVGRAAPIAMPAPGSRRCRSRPRRLLVHRGPASAADRVLTTWQKQRVCVAVAVDLERLVRQRRSGRSVGITIPYWPLCRGPTVLKSRAITQSRPCSSGARARGTRPSPSSRRTPSAAASSGRRSAASSSSSGALLAVVAVDLRASRRRARASRTGGSARARSRCRCEVRDAGVWHRAARRSSRTPTAAARW